MVIEPLMETIQLSIWSHHQLMLAHLLENMLILMKMDSALNTNIIFHFKELFSTLIYYRLISRCTSVAG